MRVEIWVGSQEHPVHELQTEPDLQLVHYRRLKEALGNNRRPVTEVRQLIAELERITEPQWENHWEREPADQMGIQHVEGRWARTHEVERLLIPVLPSSRLDAILQAVEVAIPSAEVRLS